MVVIVMIRLYFFEVYFKEDIGGEFVYVFFSFSIKVLGVYLSFLRALDNGMGNFNIGCYGILDIIVEEVYLDVFFIFKVDIICFRINMF